jgi:hypothetical protein
MKRIMLASMIAAAAMFTACDDDSSSSSDVKTYSCDINADMGVLGSVRACAEASDQAKMTDVCGKVGEVLKAFGAEDATKTGSSCASGAKKTCDGKLDGVSYTAYFYTEDDVEASCEDLLKKVEELNK